MDSIPELSNLEDTKKAVNTVAVMFGEIETYLKGLKITDPESIKKNAIQLEICRLFQEMAVKFEKADSYNSDALKDLAVIDQKFKEFFETNQAVK
jgi:hypothetical protein